MPKACKVCKLPAGEQSTINALLSRGWSPRRIATSLADVSRVLIIRHRNHHYDDDEGDTQIDEDNDTA